MYLSKLILNPRSREARRDLADCQNLHRTLLAAFPQAASETARAEFGLLYRVEVQPRSGLATVLVQSCLQPDWTKLPPDYLFEAEHNPACKSVRESYESLSQGLVVTFCLRANPTRKIDTKTQADGKKRNGKRVELFREEEQLVWLQRKAAAAGFRILALKLNADVPNVRASAENKTYGWRHQNQAEGGKKKLTFGSVLFEGELEITNPGEFQKALATGLGTGKAYGFGLLSIAPVSP